MSKKNNYCGCKNIEVVRHGSQADPDLVYNGYTFNLYDIEDALWDNFLEMTGYTDDESENREVEREFDLYIRENAEDYLNDCIFGGILCRWL